MEASPAVLAVISAAGAIAAAFFTYLSKKANAASEQQVKFYADVIAECSKLRHSNNELQRQVTELRMEVHSLREQLEFYEENHLATEARAMLEHVFNSVFTGPAWIHDLASNKWYLNDAYCREFSVTRNSFWTPVNIFARYEPEDAIRYAQHDMSVMQAGTTIDFDEKFRRRVMDPKCDDFATGRFRKTPFTINNRPYVVGKMVCLLDEDGHPIEGYTAC